MNLKCFLPSCTERPNIICMCTGNASLMCESHRANHSSDYSNNGHVYSLINKHVDPNSKTKIISELNNALRLMRASYAELTSKLINIITVGNLLLKDINMKIIHTEMILERIILSNMAPIIFRDKNGKGDILNEIDIHKEIDRHYNFNKSVFSLENKLYTEVLLSSRNILKKSAIVPVPEVPQLCSERIYAFTKNSPYLMEYNILNSTLKSLIFLQFPTQGELASILPLPNNQVFIAGGYNKIALRSTYIADIAKPYVENLPDYKSRCRAGGVYSENKVYIFGGGIPTYFNYSPMNDADSFDFKTKTWYSLANLPEAGINTSAVLHNKHNIIIAGENCSLFNYCLFANTYKVVNRSIKTSCQSMLIKDEAKIILLLNTNCYIIEETGNRKFMISGKYEFESTTCAAVVKDRNAYFISNNGKVYQLNLDYYTLTLADIKD